MKLLSYNSRWILTGLVFITNLNVANATTNWFGYFNFETGIQNTDNNKQGHYNVGQVSTIFQHEVDIYQFLAEIEYKGTPGVNDTGSGTGYNASDERASGEISIERAYGKIDLDTMLTIKIGKDLTPTLWLTNHYPNLSVPITKPQLLDADIFQETYTGISLAGHHSSGFSYSFWSGNGKPPHADPNPQATPSPTHDFTDNDAHFLSHGVRLGWTFDMANNSDVYVGALAANYIDYKDMTTVENPKPVGFETSMTFGDFNLWAEYSKKTGVTGSYLVASYAIDIGKDRQVIPWYMFDYLSNDVELKDDGTVVKAASKPTSASFGVNFRPKPNIVFKSEFSNHKPDDGNKATNTINFGFIYFFI